MTTTNREGLIRLLGAAFIVFAIAFNLPYAWLAANFDYPGILREPAGAILEAFAAGGPSLILGWLAFTLAAMLLVPVAIGVAKVTRTRGHTSAAIAAVGVAAGVTQAIGLSRWVYAVPGLANTWLAGDATARAPIEATFAMLHQFAGVGVGEAIGQTLTAIWLIGVSVTQRSHPRFGPLVAWVGLAGGVILLSGLVEGISTVIPFDPGVFGFAALVGFLVLTAWLIWTGVLCLLRPAAEG